MIPMELVSADGPARLHAASRSIRGVDLLASDLASAFGYRQERRSDYFPESFVHPRVRSRPFISAVAIYRRDTLRAE
jgi:hypothetical protein